mgnify:CR=1 FL=1
MSQLYDTLQISSHGMRVQSTRVRVITENIANAGTLPATPNETPYQKQYVQFKNVLDRELGHSVVKVDEVTTPDEEQYEMKFMPNHPAANRATHTGSSTRITTPWLFADRLWANV